MPFILQRVNMESVTTSSLRQTIWAMMNSEDLNKLTARKIRLNCQQKFNVDLADRKDEIDNIVMDIVKMKKKQEDAKIQNRRADVDYEESSNSSEEVSSDNKVPTRSQASTSKQSKASTSSPRIKVDSTSKQMIATGTTPRQAAMVATAAKKSMRTIVPPLKKRLSQLAAAAEDVAAITAAVAATATPVAPEKIKKKDETYVPPSAKIPKKETKSVSGEKKIKKAKISNINMNTEVKVPCIISNTADAENKAAAAEDVAAITAAASAAAITTAVVTEQPPKKTEAAARIPKKAAEKKKKKPEISDVTVTADPSVPLEREDTGNSSNNNNDDVEDKMDDAAYARSLQGEEWNFRKRTWSESKWF